MTFFPSWLMHGWQQFISNLVINRITFFFKIYFRMLFGRTRTLSRLFSCDGHWFLKCINSGLIFYIESNHKHRNRSNKDILNHFYHCSRRNRFLSELGCCSKDRSCAINTSTKPRTSNIIRELESSTNNWKDDYAGYSEEWADKNSILLIFFFCFKWVSNCSSCGWTTYHCTTSKNHRLLRTKRKYLHSYIWECYKEYGSINPCNEEWITNNRF